MTRKIEIYLLLNPQNVKNVKQCMCAWLHASSCPLLGHMNQITSCVYMLYLLVESMPFLYDKCAVQTPRQ